MKSSVKWFWTLHSFASLLHLFRRWAPLLFPLVPFCSPVILPPVLFCNFSLSSVTGLINVRLFYGLSFAKLSYYLKTSPTLLNLVQRFHSLVSTFSTTLVNSQHGKCLCVGNKLKHEALSLWLDLAVWVWTGLHWFPWMWTFWFLFMYMSIFFSLCIYGCTIKNIIVSMNMFNREIFNLLDFYFKLNWHFWFFFSLFNALSFGWYKLQIISLMLLNSCRKKKVGNEYF